MQIPRVDVKAANRYIYERECFMVMDLDQSIKINRAKYYSHEPATRFPSFSLYNLTLIFSNLQPRCQTFVLSKALPTARGDMSPQLRSGGISTHACRQCRLCCCFWPTSARPARARHQVQDLGIHGRHGLWSHSRGCRVCRQNYAA